MKTTAVQHTATPWTPNKHLGKILASNGESIGCVYSLNGAIRDAEEDANLQFIVTACNSHEALVSALSGVYAAFNTKMTAKAEEECRAALKSAGAL